MSTPLQQTLKSSLDAPHFSVQSSNESLNFHYEPYADRAIEDQHNALLECSTRSPMLVLKNGSFVSSPRNVFSRGAHLLSQQIPFAPVDTSIARQESDQPLEGERDSYLLSRESSRYDDKKLNELLYPSKKNAHAEEKQQLEELSHDEGCPDIHEIRTYMNSFSFGRILTSEIVDNASFARRQDEGKSSSYIDTYYNLSIPYTESCTSKKDLDNDSPSVVEMWYALRSANLIRYMLKAFRVMVFSVLPCFLLIHLPATRDWFTAGPLVPAIAAALTSDNVAEQLKLTLMIIQVCVILVPWGLIVECANMEGYFIAWWFAVLAFPFVIGVMGNFQAKRMTMVYGVMMMEFSRQTPSNSSSFAIYFSIDLVIASLFALLSALLPYPVFAYRVADEQMAKLHVLYADALSKVVKSFWAPVLLEAEVARTQISWSDISQERKVLEQHIQNIPYEPVELGLKNTFRKSRLQHLAKIRRRLYTLAASSSLHNEFRKEGVFVSESEIVEKVQEKLSSMAFNLTEEANQILVALGTSIYPKEVLKIRFGPLTEMYCTMENLVNSERDRTLLAKALSSSETNSLLRLFAFHTTLLTAVGELLQIEAWALNFDEKTCPTWLQRLKSLLVGERYTDWKGAIVDRLLLRTPEDVRVAKDSVRYALGLFVAVVFAHWNTGDTTNSYYYGMGILTRLAQQTASETLQIGIMRVCGLALGASFAHSISSLSFSLWLTTFLVFVFGLICVTVSNHPSYGHVGQYALIVAVAVIPVSDIASPEYVLNRIAANCFAFTGYLAVCLAVFPVDPIYVVSNYYVRIVQAANDLTHLLVVLGCCPIKKGCEESSFLLEKANTLVVQQQRHLSEALQWNVTAGAEPTVRGLPYPVSVFGNFFLHFAELTSLQEGLLESMKSLHRHRLSEPNLIIYGILEVIRPFLIDAAKITHRFFQHCIDASEKPFEWCLTDAVGELWRAKLSIISLQRVTGHIQRSFISVLLPHRKSMVNKNGGASYVPVEVMESTILEESFANRSSLEGLAGMMESFRLEMRKRIIDREDFCVFEKIVVKFILLISTLSSCLDFIIAIHKYELSRQHSSQGTAQKDSNGGKKRN